jgi:hypothetical protein
MSRDRNPREALSNKALHVRYVTHDGIKKKYMYGTQVFVISVFHPLSALLEKTTLSFVHNKWADDGPL